MASFQGLFGVGSKVETPRSSDILSDDPGGGAVASSEAAFVTPASLSNFAFMVGVTNMVWQFLGRLSDNLTSEWTALVIAAVIGAAIFLANRQTQTGAPSPVAVQLLVGAINVVLLAAAAVGIQSGVS